MHKYSDKLASMLQPFQAHEEQMVVVIVGERVAEDIALQRAV